MIQTVQLLKQLPDIDALVVLAGVNDLHHRLSADTEFRSIDKEPRSAFPRLYAMAFSVRPEARITRFWEPVALRRSFERVRQRWDLPEDQVQDDAGRIYEQWRRHRREASALRSELPDLGPALLEYARNLHTIVDVAERRGVRVVFTTQPVMWHAEVGPEERELLWLGGVGPFQSEPGHEYYSVEALAEGMARYNATLLEVCASRRLGCVDLAAALARDTSAFYDLCHFNEGGSRRVAALLSEHFLRTGPFAKLAAASY